MTALSPIAMEALERARAKPNQPARNPVWTDAEDKLLIQLYSDTPMPDLIKRLQRTDRSIYQRARTLSLKRSREFLASAHAGRLKLGAQVGKASQFKKGQTAWNKGMKGIQPGGRAKETQFRRGDKPKNWQPIGHERIAGGYLQRKVTDTGYTPTDYVEVQRLVWEEHNGPIPPGHIILFKDGNKLNTAIENLELITRAENMRRNTIHRYPPELKDVIRLQKKLERTIRNRRDEEPAD